MAANSIKESQILASWNKNAAHWVTAIREEQIQSRNLATNKAIVNAILSVRPRHVLDVGCGEGWLVRELGKNNVHAVGIDAEPRLIEEAKNMGGGVYHTLSYEHLASGRLGFSFDVIACNFSMLGMESAACVFNVAPSLLNTHGWLIVQTLHPLVSCGDLPYQDGWRDGSWDGFGKQFTDPAPWYFRTLESWVNLFAESGFQLRHVLEPIYPETRKPAAIIFLGKMAG